MAGDEQTPAARQCDRMPAGWACSRDYEHDGPCAAVPTGEQLDDRAAKALGAALADRLMVKADAGTRLFFALYHHPQAKEMVPELLMSSLGFRRAYDDACAAYLTRR